MLMRMPAAPPLRLTSEQRTALDSWTRSRTLQHRRGQRARIIMMAAEGIPNAVIAAQLNCTRMTVLKWRARFEHAGLAGLEEAEGRGRPAVILQATTERIVAATLRRPPHGVTHWSARLLAQRFGVSHTTVQRIWKEHGLRPHRTRSFKFSNDPQLEEKVSDVIGLYLHPPEHALVLCVDEKSQIQALDRTQPLLPMRPHQVERRTHDYVRHGTTTLFAALDIATGQVTGRCYERHRRKEFLAFLSVLDRRYPTQEIHLVLDNYHTHKHPLVDVWLAERPRFRLHFTPTSASWMNQVETWFSLLQRRAIQRGVFSSVAALKQAIRRFLDGWNDHSHPFAWVKTPEEVLMPHRQRISESQD